MSSRQLSQQEIDNLFGDSQARLAQQRRAVPYDFRRPDRISKTQVRAIHMLHDTFVRNLVSSLSAYLRAYLTINLISVEQLSYAEFLEGLPSPTCLVSVGLKPYEGSAALELNPSLVFPLIEMLLGGSGSMTVLPQREVTEIEQKLLENLFRVILQDLKSAWKAVTTIEFAIDSMETEPQFLKILAPSEAVVAVSIEIRVGEHSGMMNIAIPCIVIKMMRQKFDQQWSIRKAGAAANRQAQILELIRPAMVDIEARLEGPAMMVKELDALEAGDVLVFDYPVDRPLNLRIGGAARYEGRIETVRHKKGFRIAGLAAGLLPPEPVMDGPQDVTAG